ncbi:unnamed protein product, partial [Symbiodinium sp. CCMP2456]
LCRFFTWHFAEVSEAACTVSEICSSEEWQLWERLCLVASASFHADGAASCLRLALATAPYGTAPSAASQGSRWDVGHALLEYVRKRRLVSASCRLSPREELDLLAERGSQSQGAHCAVGELAGRRAALQALVAGGQSRRIARDFHRRRTQCEWFRSDSEIVVCCDDW